jgi:hypothetical protein
MIRIGDVYEYIDYNGELEDFSVEILAIKSMYCADVLIRDRNKKAFEYSNWHINYNNIRLLRRDNIYQYH